METQRTWYLLGLIALSFMILMAWETIREQQPPQSRGQNNRPFQVLPCRLPVLTRKAAQ